MPQDALQLDRRQMTRLALAHALCDVYQGAVPALLPFLLTAHDWSYGTGSLLVLAATMSSSIVQPLFGHLSDRRPAPWLMPAGFVVAAAGLAVVGLLGSPVAAFLAVLASGLGVAAFHPEGSRAAAYAAGPLKATGMSYFSVGGNAGWALGPMLVTATVLPFGLHATVLLALPGLAGAVLTARELPRLREARTRATAHAAALARATTAANGRAAAVLHDDWRAFVTLTGAVAARSIVYFGLMTFVPLYFTDVLHTPKAAGETALIAFLVAGALGTLVGGRLADRIGRRPLLLASFTLQAPLLILFLLGGPVLATVALGLIGLIAIATFSISVVMGQAYLPNHLGVASGVTLGLAIGVGGLAAAALGPLADAAGPRAPLEVIVLLPLAGLACVLALPREAGAASVRARLRRRPALLRAS
ncbi:MFS transporter [Paraconexibacter antarcticus]|uniref:MFS transporter n=1 Tax=Paraconexibacter antarcticus TaxID=2949664 RepID=A0ABY5DUJ5_9ACTN|nr:MFS transporter [Paraconexibacter antarcticus]UTI64696.1 MFS transporter [Paraconexibacter antarcticus]